FQTVHIVEGGAAIAWGDGDEIDIAATTVERLADESMTPADFSAFLQRHSLSFDAAAAQLGISRRLVAYYVKEREIPRYIALACAYLDTALPSAAESVSAHHGGTVRALTPALLKEGHAAVARSTGGKRAVAWGAKPVVSPKKSVTSEYIICLEDGRKFKSLKRHLRTQYNISPEEYREKWGLPPDYPMVAPAYAKARSALAKKMGLSQLRRRHK
ncbi:MAG TPA: MucR family transcriptional regulator, partial [Candidatus Acidoferrales bacterium]|nr:MucR family transcriptional regulator [Candidatus Acidoferrales bacterium]